MNKKNQEPKSSGPTGLFRALSSRNYRLFFLGQSVSLIGTWMQQVAMSWLVYRLTGSALLLGTIGFTSQIPTFVIAPFAGVLADRWNRRRLLMLTQTLAMLQAFLLAFLVLNGSVTVWQLVGLSLCLGCVNGVDIPVRQSFVVEMVEEKVHLANAIALNSSMVNAARLIGPSVAGLVISLTGEGICFLINGVSYLAVLASLYFMHLSQPRPRPPGKPFLHELREGFGYAFSFPPIRGILLLVSLMSLTGMPYAVLLPVFAREILGGGAHTFGFLVGASGLGAFAGTVFLASRRNVIGLGRIIVISCALFGVGIACFSLSRNLWLSLAALLFSGYGAMTLVASCNTILQTIVEEDKRGRVMSLLTVAFMGMAPLGSLCAGAIASRFGAPFTVFVGGVSCVLGAAAFAARLPVYRKLLRPIYREMGIFP